MLRNSRFNAQLQWDVRRILGVVGRAFARWPRVAIGAIALATFAIIGVVDYLTGLEVSLSVFHLVPVSFAVWYGKKHDGLIIAIIASSVWSVDDFVAGYAYGHPGILIWDIVMHGTILTFSAISLRKLREHLNDEQRLAREDSLTGILNLRAFQERLDYSLALSA